ncbi:unnamed protein product, partial [marine sediment metagenome]
GLIDEAVLDELVLSVSGGQAIPPATTSIDVATPFEIEVTVTTPTIPLGYTYLNVRVSAVLDGDPSPVLTRTVYASQSGVAGLVATVTVPAGGLYQIATWLTYTRDSDAKIFHSAATRETDTVVEE